MSYEKASDTSEKVSQGIQELINKTNDKKLENYYLFKFSTQHKPTLWDCSKPSQKIESELNLEVNIIKFTANSMLIIIAIEQVLLVT